MVNLVLLFFTLNNHDCTFNIPINFINKNNMETQKETIAQEALRLLKNIPEDKFITTKFTNYVDSCCVLGHYNRLKSKNPKDYSKGNTEWKYEGEELRTLSIKFIRDTYNLFGTNIADINNEPVIKFYPQETAKQRSIAVLEDMVKEGY